MPRLAILLIKIHDTYCRLNMDIKKDDIVKYCSADIEHVAAFIEKYLPLANLHNTNFIISGYWDQVWYTKEWSVAHCSNSNYY